MYVNERITNKRLLISYIYLISKYELLGSQNRSGINHHSGIYMHSNNDILDVPDGQSRDNSSNVDGPRNSLHHGWNRESLLGRSYRDVREAVAANTLPNYSALASIPSSHSRDNTLSREIHHFTVRVTTLKLFTETECIM